MSASMNKRHLTETSKWCKTTKLIQLNNLRYFTLSAINYCFCLHGVTWSERNVKKLCNKLIEGASKGSCQGQLSMVAAVGCCMHPQKHWVKKNVPAMFIQSEPTWIISTNSKFKSLCCVRMRDAKRGEKLTAVIHISCTLKIRWSPRLTAVLL